MNFYFYKAKVVRVIDGDTIVCDIDLGFDNWIHNEHVRLLGINTPEVRTRDVIEKAAGLEAKLYVERFLNVYEGNVILETAYDSGGKYGRTLANVYVVHEDTDDLVNLNERLIDEGYAVLYN
jgi:micrococcal nuclease